MTMLLSIPFLIPFALFLLLALIVLYKQDRATPQIAPTVHQEHEKYIHFDFGNLWVYDSDPTHIHQKPVLVFIHSIGSSVYSWRYQIDAFKTNYRVIAFDLLGFGKSDKPLDASYNLDSHTQRILKLLDHMKIDKCSLVGCSLGGALSLWLASQQSKRFHSVIALAPAAVTSVVPFYPLKHHLLAPLASKLVSRSLIRAALFNGGYAYTQNITPDVIENYYAPFSDPKAIHCFLKTVETIKDKRIFNHLKDISIPTLLLWGERDRVVRKKDIHQIIAQMPQALTIYHPHAGHHIMEDEPLWTNEKIAAFLLKNS